MNIIAIIPARGGSKRIPNKNIVSLDGRPLIAYTIIEAKKSSYITRMIVSTDSKDIAEVSKQYGAEVMMRHKELAEDTTPTLDVLKYILKDIDTDCIILLQPTSPLRKREDIDNVIKLMNSADSVSSVYQLSDGLYKENGAVYGIKKDVIMKQNSLYSNNHLLYVMPKERSIDIDEPIDLKIAEALIKNG